MKMRIIAAALIALCLSVGARAQGVVPTYGSLVLTPGGVPSPLANGQIWTTSAGIFVRVAGVTVGPLASSSASGTPGGATNSVQLNAGGGVFGGASLGSAQVLIGQASGPPLAQSITGCTLTAAGLLTCPNSTITLTGGATGTGTSSIAVTLGNPGPSTLGGIESIASVSHQFITAISTSGVPSLAQPTFADLASTPTTLGGYGITGGTLTTELIAAASASGGAGFNLPQGVAPTSPVNGDIWTTAAGLFVRINGVTIGPLAPSGGSSWNLTDGTTSLTGVTNLTVPGGTLKVGGTPSAATLTPIVTDTLHAASATTANIGGQDDYNGSSITATLATLASGQSLVVTDQNASALTLALGGQTVVGLPLATTLHTGGFYGFTFNSGSTLSGFGFPGFGTITTNALMKFDDATGAATSSGLTDNGTTVSTAENVTISGATVTLSAIPSGTIASGKNLGLNSSNQLVAATVSGGGGGISTITDGVNTVSSATQLTVTGGTVGGTTPNATLTITGGGVGLSVLRSYLAGVQLSNDGVTPNSVLDISAGTAANSTNASMISIAAFTKTTGGTWVSGTGNAGMGSGLTVAATTWYNVCLATISAASDIFFDTDVACATHAPASTTAVRRIGAFLTDGSSHIVAFSQNGDEFLWLAPFQDANNTAISATRTLITLTVPPGVKVNAKMRGEGGSGANSHYLISSPDETAVSAQSVLGNSTFQLSPGGTFTFAGNIEENRTNTSGQIAVATASGETGNVIYVATYGWVDRRGRDN